MFHYVEGVVRGALIAALSAFIRSLVDRAVVVLGDNVADNLHDLVERHARTAPTEAAGGLVGSGILDDLLEVRIGNAPGADPVLGEAPTLLLLLHHAVFGPAHGASSIDAW